MGVARVTLFPSRPSRIACFSAKVRETQMPLAKMALLPDRGVVRVAGADAEKFLNGIVTADLSALATQAAVHAALLTPQGKMLFEFFVTKAPDGAFLMETARDMAEGLVKRLKMFMLRAKVEAENASSAYEAAATWDGDAAPKPKRIVYADPRLAAMGARVLAPVPPGFGAASGAEGNAEWVPTEAYHAHRIALGVPEAGRDFPLGDTFPHEADLDLLNGISFSKGCFVGQEVVARMKHKGNVRKRVVPVEADAPLRSGAPITVGGSEIGRIGSVAGARGLALIRLDRAAEAGAKGQSILADGVAVRLRKLEWAIFEPAPMLAAGPASENA
jgi:folate-binding protein YgfZ